MPYGDGTGRLSPRPVPRALRAAGTGPMGTGPIGWGRGPCGRGARMGRGRGFGQGMGPGWRGALAGKKTKKSEITTGTGEKNENRRNS